ncbi:MAG: ABC transporter permease [Clostridiales bacterium]|uniref:ABC transporter permease n=1 Tax=Vescimonas sp. TaxID=2892404 RepID=UPI00307BA38E|nr:ABC transporter permease [Clostridiales bacterium]
MLKYILKRLLMAIPVLLGVTFIVFTIMSFTPGDPVQTMLGDNYTQEAYDEITEELGLNDPFLVRYVNYVVDLVQGDMGVSYSTKRAVSDEIFARFPATVRLAGAAIFLAVVFGIPLGVISATKQYSFFDSGSMFVALVGVSMPNFWLGIMLILLFAANLGWLPASGDKGFLALILPAVTLSANSLATITRMTRSSMLETIRMDYIRTARAKGLRESRVIIHHALRNAMIPVITSVGLQFGFALSGAVLVETVFSWPGIGRLLVDTIKLKDTPVVLGVVVVMAASFTVINLVIDILYACFDPRIRTQYK